MKDIDNNKVISIAMSFIITFYEELTEEHTFGSNDIGYEIYYNSKKGIMQVLEIGAFGDRTLLKQYQDRRGRGITVNEMLENMLEIKNMTYKEFKEKILGGT